MLSIIIVDSFLFTKCCGSQYELKWILSLVSHIHTWFLVHVGFFFPFSSMTSQQFSNRLSFSVYIYSISIKTYYYAYAESFIFQAVRNIAKIWQQAKFGEIDFLNVFVQEGIFHAFCSLPTLYSWVIWCQY